MKEGILFSLLWVLFACNCQSDSSSETDSIRRIDTTSIQVLDSSKTTIEQKEEVKDLISVFSINDLFKNESSDVVNTLALENFELVIKKINHYRNSKEIELSPTQKANFRFMHLYAFAGLVSQKKKTHEEMGKLLEKYIGKDIVARRYTVTKGVAMPFNQVQVEQEKKDTVEIICANNNGINIHCLVYAGMIEEINLEDNIGKQAYLCGKLERFILSDKTVVSWIASIKLSNGFVRILENEMN